MRLARPTLAHSRLIAASASGIQHFAHAPVSAGPSGAKQLFATSAPPVKRAVSFATRAASGYIFPPSLPQPPGHARVSAAGSESRGQIRVQHILLNPDEEETAEQLTVALQGGESFEELAKKHSRCPTAANGGDVGWVVKGQLEPAFEAAAFALPVGGEQVRSVKTRFGLHLVRVLSERPAPAVVKEMSVEDLSVRLVEGPSTDLQLIDVREQHEWEICKLPGFKLYPTSLFREWAPTLMGSLDPACETIVLCHHGVRSRNVADWLVRQAGFTDVHNVTGGIDLYARAVEKGMPRY